MQGFNGPLFAAGFVAYISFCICWGFQAWNEWASIRWDLLVERLAREKGANVPSREKQFPSLEEVEPFERMENPDHRFKMIYLVLGISIILPIKLFFIIVVAAVHFAIYRTVLFFSPMRRDKNGDETCGSRGLWILKLISGWIIRTVMLLLNVVTIREHCSGPERRCSPKGWNEFPHVVVSNHVSALDVLFFMQRDFCSFVAKDNVSRIPIVGLCARVMRVIFVERACEVDRNQALQRIRARQLSLSKDSTGSSEFRHLPPPLVIFPEGTTSSGRSILPFKRGAFSSLLPVTPCVLVYRSSFFHPSFDLLSGLTWSCLLLSTIHPITLDVYWLDDIVPPPADVAAAKQSAPIVQDLEAPRTAAFKQKVRCEMNMVLQGALEEAGFSTKSFQSSCSGQPAAVPNGEDAKHRSVGSTLSSPGLLPENWDSGLQIKQELVAFFGSLARGGNSMLVTAPGKKHFS